MRKLWRRRLLAVLALAALVTACAAGPAREAGEAAGQPVYFLAVGRRRRAKTPSR